MIDNKARYMYNTPTLHGTGNSLSLHRNVSIQYGVVWLYVFAFLYTYYMKNNKYL